MPIWSVDFSVLNVAENSHSAKPLIYKISGVWGNHEGSMLLWVLILALVWRAVAVFGTHLPSVIARTRIGGAGLIGVAFPDSLSCWPQTPSCAWPIRRFRATASTRFCRTPPSPSTRRFLYAGYVGLSISFSFAVAALLEGKVDAAWARWVPALGPC